MDRRTLVEFVAAWVLVLLGGLITLLPIFNASDVKCIFIVIISVYGIVHLLKNIYILKTKEYSSFYITGASVITLILLNFFDISDSPWNLALVLFIWVIMVSLIKLKECDYYHDNKSYLWILNIVNLILFILTGVLTAVNLYYTGDIQILVLGFFFLINGILELMDPIVAYILEKK